MWLLLLVLVSVSDARRPSAADCDEVQRVIDVLWTARSVAEVVGPTWPGFGPTLVGTRFHTRRGLVIQVGRNEEPSCLGLTVPARIAARRRPAAQPFVGLERKRGTFSLRIDEPEGGIPLEDLTAAIVHHLFHVHQYRSTTSWRDVNGRPNWPDAAWASRQVPGAATDARRLLALVEDLLVGARTAETLQRLVSARRQHQVRLEASDRRLLERVLLTERVEGTAAWMELQIVSHPRARQILLDAGVPPRELAPARWQATLLAPTEDYVHATGLGVALVLDALGYDDWPAEVETFGFDRVLERAVADLVRTSR